jgi:hypothetical protein
MVEIGLVGFACPPFVITPFYSRSYHHLSLVGFEQ